MSGLLSNNPGPNTSGSSLLTAEMGVSVVEIGAPTMTYAQLVADTAATSVLACTLAWTSDIGLVVSNGLTWGAVGTSGSGGGAKFGTSISITLAASQDNLNPAAIVVGTTNRVIATPAGGGSTVNGFIAYPDGSSVLWVNPSATDSITFPYHAGTSTAANQFSTPQGVSAILAPLTNAIITYVANQWEFAG
jgi:hypothetical protein